MPLKTTVGLCKKLGLPDYGSLGATCHVEFELDAEHVQQDLDTFHQQVQAAFVACRQAVQDELARQQATQPAPAINQQPSALVSATPARPSGNGPAPKNAATNGHGVSQKQIAYLTQLARRIPDLGATGLDHLAQQRHGKTVLSLTSLEASALIDVLKAIRSGEVELASLLEGAAV